MGSPNELRARIIRLISGNIAGLTDREDSIFNWIVADKILGNSLGNLQASCRRTVTPVMGMWGGKDMVHAGCWAHVRRYFFQAVQLNSKDLLALGIVTEIDKLFELEAEAKAVGLGAAERLGLRREKAEPIVEGLKQRIESARAITLPRSALGKACDYALGRWGPLSRFLEYGQLELSNNLAENAIRPIAIGRKNWLHVGSERAGPPVAAIISIV